mmetsp:Transcript_26147/g.77575  ORF Transcript_26147/g.77575 Transcript_26147/m.77575 type:complete len:233 (+) Transcript_26147:331-1029(+)
MSASVARSTFAVASSSARTLASCSSARARQKSWRWPTERLSPASAMRASSPPPLLITPFSFTADSTSHSRESSWPRNGSRLLRTVPLKSTGSCGMMASWRRSTSSPTRVMSTPSSRMAPLVTSMSRKSVSIRLLLPLPVRPTRPHELPPGSKNDTPDSTGGRPGRYTAVTSAYSSAPERGQPPGGAPPPSASSGGSCGRRVYSSSRSSAVMLFSTSAVCRTNHCISPVSCSV